MAEDSDIIGKEVHILSNRMIRKPHLDARRDITKTGRPTVLDQYFQYRFKRRLWGAAGGASMIGGMICAGYIQEYANWIYFGTIMAGGFCLIKRSEYKETENRLETKVKTAQVVHGRFLDKNSSNRATEPESYWGLLRKWG